MKVQKNRFFGFRLKLLLTTVTLLLLLASVYAQQPQTQEVTAQGMKFDVELNEVNVLGEKIPIVFLMKNVGGDKQKVKDISRSRINLKIKRTTGEQAPEVFEKLLDGTQGNIIATKNEDGSLEWVLVEKDDIVLAKDESTKLKIKDLSDLFGTDKRFGPGDYILTAENGGGQSVERNFKIVIDQEKTIPLLALKMRSEDWGERNWAVQQLINIDRTKAITMLNEMLSSEDKSLKNWAAYYLDVLGIREL